MDNVDLITSAVVEYRNAMSGKPQCSAQSLLDSDDVPTLILSSGVIIAANKAALDSFGLGLKGLTFRSILVDDPTRVDEFEESIEERGRSRPKIFSVRNSTQRWRAEGRKLGGDTGEVIVRLKDVTEANATYAAFRKKNNQLLLEVSELELKRVRLESALKIFEGVFQSAAIGIEIRKFTGERVLVNDAFKKIAQLPLLDDGVVNQVLILSNDGQEINLDSLVSDIQNSGSNCHVFECKVGNEPTSAVWCRATSSLMPTSSGSSHVVLTVYEDIDAQRRTEESNRLLLNEVSHRAKNALAVVQGLAIQIFRQDMPKDVLLKRFEERMQVLAKSHDLLSRREWQPATIQEIVCNAVEDGWGFEEDQIILDLTPTPIRSQEVVMFSMIIHELMTNALKHGALSHPSGSLLVRSSERVTDDQRWIDLEWIESSEGDFVPPSSHGFGLQLLERAPRFGLSGQGKLEVEPNGLTYRLSFPVLGSAKMFSKD